MTYSGRLVCTSLRTLDQRRLSRNDLICSTRLCAVICCWIYYCLSVYLAVRVVTHSIGVQDFSAEFDLFREPSKCGTVFLLFVRCVLPYIMSLHYVFTLCLYIMSLHYVFTSCLYIMSLHYIFTLCLYIMSLHYVFTICLCLAFMYLLRIVVICTFYETYYKRFTLASCFKYSLCRQ